MADCGFEEWETCKPFVALHISCWQRPSCSAAKTKFRNLLLWCNMVSGHLPEKWRHLVFPKTFLSFSVAVTFGVCFRSSIRASVLDPCNISYGCTHSYVCIMHCLNFQAIICLFCLWFQYEACCTVQYKASRTSVF